MLVISARSASNWALVLVITAVTRRGRLARSWHSLRHLFMAATKGTMSSWGSNQYGRIPKRCAPDRVEGVHPIRHRGERDGVECQSCVVLDGVYHIIRAKSDTCIFSPMAVRSGLKRYKPFPFVHKLRNDILHGREHVSDRCSSKYRHE